MMVVAGEAEANAKSCGSPAKTKIGLGSRARVIAGGTGNCASASLANRSARNCALRASIRTSSASRAKVIAGVTGQRADVSKPKAPPALRFPRRHGGFTAVPGNARGKAPTSTAGANNGGANNEGRISDANSGGASIAGGDAHTGDNIAGAGDASTEFARS
jgi:hypothetical protein